MKNDIVGKKFNMLTALEYVGGGKWRFRCDCGNEIIRIRGWVTNKTRPIKSCGCIKNIKARWTGHGEISGTYWGVVRKNAKSRQLDFDITIEEAWWLFLKQDKRCVLTKELLTFAQNYNKEIQTASLDRIDHSKGYTSYNVRWVHKGVNKMRMDLDVETFREWCRKILKT